MQKNFVLMLLLTAALLTASTIETGPLEPQIPPWQHLWEGLMPVDQRQNDGTSIIPNNAEPDPTLQGGGGTGTPSEFDDPSWQQPACDWGDDVLVGEPGYKSSGRISVDNDDATGDIYVCMLHRDVGVYDTAHMWRSTDGGATWASFPHVIGGTTQGNIVDAQILCGHGPGDTTWLYFVEATDSAGLRIRRTTPDGATFRWTTIDTSNSIVRVAMDRNIENPEHIFCFWQTSAGTIRGMSSTNAGATWANPALVSTGRRGISCAAGGDGYGYVAYMDDTDSTFIRLGRFKNNLVTPNWTFNDVDTGSGRRFREVSIAAARTAPGDSQVAIALATYRRTDNNNIAPRYAYTQNGGTSWSASLWPVTNQVRSTWLMRFPRIRRSYDDNLFRAIVSVPETTTSWDTIVYAYTTAGDPTTWTARGEFNDHRNTGEVSHDVGSSSLTMGGFIAYREYGLSKVWFDGFDFTGIGAGPTLVQTGRLTTVFGGGANLTLSKRSRVSASVYNQDGRLVRELFNGTMEAGRHKLGPAAYGVSFLRVTVDGKVETAKLVHLQ
jgi:hypothetical protein